MTALRNIAQGAALMTLVLFAAPAMSTNVSMANGQVTFTTPDSWRDIMDTQGIKEAHVYQVPDSSPTGQRTLARVSVSVRPEPDINSFHQYIAQATAKALALPGYQMAHKPPQPNSLLFTAMENGEAFEYIEHYWLKNGNAIKLRCQRPQQTLAGEAWISNFDAQCSAIAAQLK